MVKKAKPKKVVKEPPERKRIPKSSRIVDTIAATLQNHSDGEFQLPSVLKQYTSGPKVPLGLHREYYIPVIGNAPYHPPDTKEAWDIFSQQASEIFSELIAEGFPITHYEYDLPLCEDCK